MGDPKAEIFTNEFSFIVQILGAEDDMLKTHHKSDDVNIMIGETSVCVDLIFDGLHLLNVFMPRHFGSDDEWSDEKWTIETVWISIRAYLSDEQFSYLMQHLLMNASKN